VLEAIEAVKRNYKIDNDKVSVRGLLDGGRRVLAIRGALPRSMVRREPRGRLRRDRALPSGLPARNAPADLVRAETLAPLRLHPTTPSTSPSVRPSHTAAALDSQKQAGRRHGRGARKGRDQARPRDRAGPRSHAYHPQAKLEVERRMAGLAEAGRSRFPRDVHFTTYTLKYNRSNWGDHRPASAKHWKKARVDGDLTPDGTVTLKTGERRGVDARISVRFGPVHPEQARSRRHRRRFARRRSAGFPTTHGASRSPEPEYLEGRRSVSRVGSQKHNLQGPIDDAFMDSFVFVRPTGKSPRAKVQAWVEQEMARAVEHWRRQFRGEVRVVDDTSLSDADIASSNLVVWGDIDSNAYLKKWRVGRRPSSTASLHDERCRTVPSAPLTVAVRSPLDASQSRPMYGTVLESSTSREPRSPGTPPRSRGALCNSRTSRARAMWTYLTQPFSLTLPGFRMTELDPWEEAGQDWRRLRVDCRAAWPRIAPNKPSISRPTGSWYVTTTTSRSAAAQLQRTTSPITSTSKASWCLPRTGSCRAHPDGQSLAEPVIVSIGLSEITFS